MNIGIDIRPLLEPKRSGVGEYTYNLLNAIFSISQDHNYFLFYNSFKKVDELLPTEWKNFPNVYFCGFRWPNKVFNFCLKFFKWPKLNKLILKSKIRNQKSEVDAFFIPNLNFVALSHGVKKIITVHDLSFERYPGFFSLKRRLWHRFINPKKLIGSCDKIIAVSENTKRDLVDLYGIASEKIRVVYSGVTSDFGFSISDFRIDKIKKKYNLPEHFILFLGTLEPRKNIEGLIRAFEIFKQKYELRNTNYELLIVGPCGWLYKKIFRRAKKSPFAKDIKFINYINPREKSAFYKLADLFVYYSFYEGFGFPPLEAQAAGTPVIVSTVSSLSEVMGEAVLMVDPYNPAELAKVMVECLTDDDLRNNLIEKGKKQTAKFSWKKCAKETLQLLQSRR